MKLLLISFLFFLQSGVWRVQWCIDGDTLILYKDTQLLRVRLAYIDCPELHQEYGEQAKEELALLTYGHPLTIKRIDVDKYGRTVALVYSGDVCINEQLVKQGYCWCYEKYCPPSYYQEMLEARRQHLHLWSTENPQPPFIFRQQHKY